MSNEGGVGTNLGDLRYRKVADAENADYIGISVHYPYYKNSLLNNAGFGGITRVVIKGGSKRYVFGTETADTHKNPIGGATEAEMNIGCDKEPSIEITNADEVYLITKTKLDTDMGTLGVFEKTEDYPDYLKGLINDTLIVWEKYGDYGKALEPSAKLHSNMVIYNSMMMSHNNDRTASYCTDPVITIPAVELESLVYTDTGTLELLPALPEELRAGGSLGGSVGVSLCSGGKLRSLDWNGEAVTAFIENGKGTKLKLTPLFSSLTVDGTDVTGEILTDETGDRYYPIKTDGKITAVFSLTLIDRIMPRNA